MVHRLAHAVFGDPYTLGGAVEVDGVRLGDSKFAADNPWLAMLENSEFIGATRDCDGINAQVEEVDIAARPRTALNA